MKYKYIISGLILCCIILSILYLNKPKVITIEEKIAKLDSTGFMINETSKPDTVIKDSIIYIDKEVFVEKIVVETDTMIIHDTLYTEQKIPFIKSIKNFKSEYIGGKVIAYAPCPVDSFSIEMGLDRKAFTELYMENCEPPNKKWYYAGGGYIAGILTILILN
jgi:hypothetical protein